MAYSSLNLQAKHGVLKFDLKQLTETEILPLADVLSHVESSEWHAVDVVHNKQIAYGQMLLRVLRLIGSKLRLVDFKRIMFDRDVLRYFKKFNVSKLCLFFHKL
jgi:hypothetical protein